MSSFPVTQMPRTSSKELTAMRKRIILGSLALAAIAVFALPSASASAATAWWQVLAGSRPTNLWEPESNVQEIQAGPGVTIVSLEEANVACMFSPFCTFLGLPNSETAQQLQEALEAPGAYGAGNVEVKEEPEASRRFIVTSIGEDAGRAVSPLAVAGEGAGAKVLQLGGSGNLVLTLTNLGDAPIKGDADPVEITDQMPAGVVATGVEAFAGWKNKFGPEIHCSVESSDEVACSFEGELPPFEAIEVEVAGSLSGSPPSAGAPGTVSVSGGGAASVTTSQPVNVSPQPVRFGIEQFSAAAEEEGGEPASQAGGHPFQFTTTLQLNVGRVTPGSRRDAVVEQPAVPRNLRFRLPAGLVGNATVTPTCPMAIFLVTFEGSPINGCPDASVVGASSATIIEHNVLGLLREAIPVFNLPPAQGEPARFGFMAGGVPVIIDTAIDPTDQYRIIASVRNIPQIAQLLSATTSLWGAPGDKAHDNARGWPCVYGGDVPRPCERPPAMGEAAFLRDPVSCSEPLGYDFEFEPWNVPIGSQVVTGSFHGPALEGCNQVPFDPTINSAPGSSTANASSGLDFRLDMPNSNLLNKDGIAEGQAKKVEVTLPQGVTINPSQAEGLGACSPAQYAQETFESGPGEGCPESSKVGSVEISTPLLDEEAHGSVYVATPYDNSFNSLLALYFVAKIPDRGVLVKQAGEVRLDPETGQVVTIFDSLPQIPFDSFTLHLFEGDRAPLVMPATCGKYDITAKFTPWTAADPDNPQPNEIITKTSSFIIDQGPDGGACPGGTPPFKPGFTAGTENNAAGSFSPLDVRLTRNDGEQEFRTFSLKLPKGLTAKLAGIPYCPEAAIAAARARTGPAGGEEELKGPSCPDASQIGRTLVGAGVGPTLTYIPGRLYLAGPYKGAPLSVVAITPAKVGPFDLGDVVIRQGLNVDPETAEVSTDGAGGDPIPRILQGIVVHARDIQIYADRKDFALNPTSCERMTAAATVLGSGLNFGGSAGDQSVDVTSPFQAADCAGLAFKPQLKISLKGSTKHAGHPALKAVVTYPNQGAYANIARAQVNLPRSEFLDQGNLNKTCTKPVLLQGKCPKTSIYGRVKAWTPLLDEPLKGNVYLVGGFGYKLPALVAELNGQIRVLLKGKVDSGPNHGIRSTFEAVPDAPVSRFVLEMKGGKKFGLLENSESLCSKKAKRDAIVRFTGQNGAVESLNPKVVASCGRGKKKAGGKEGE